MKDPSKMMLYDLIAETRKNVKLSNKIQKGYDRIASLREDLSKGKSVTEEVAQEMFNLMVTCGWNAGILVPYFFPTYIDGGPLDLLNRPYMFAMQSLAGHTTVTFRAGRQIGKCVEEDTPLNFEDGSSCTIGELFEEGIYLEGM